MYRITGFIAILALGWQTAGGQVSFSSLDDIWKYADSHNVTIKNASWELDKVLYAKKQSYMAFLPSVGLTGSMVYNEALQTTLIPGEIFGGPPGSYRPVQFGQKYIYSGGVAAQMDIVNLQTWYNMRIAKETEELNKASLGNTRKLTYQQIATQYYGYILSKEAARLATLSSAIADSVYQSVSNKYKEGTVSLANVDIAQLNKERSEQTRVAAQYQMQISKNTLRSMLDMAVTDSIDIRSSLSDDIKASAPGSFAEDPAVRLADFQCRVNKSLFQSAKSNFAPTLSILYNNTTQQNANTFEPFKSDVEWYPARYWTLRATWNILTGGTRWLQTEKNKVSYYESRLQWESTQKQSAINDENLRLNYLKASALLEKSRHVMELSYDNYVHVSDRYETGLANVEDRLNAFKDYIDYQNQYLSNLSDMLVQLYQVRIRQQNF